MHITFGGILFIALIILLVIAIILINRWRKTGTFKFSPFSFLKTTKIEDDNVVIIEETIGLYSERWEDDKLKDYIPQLYRNNNKEYVVLQKLDDKFIPYYPNDTTIYYPPDEWAQVLMMKANEDLFKKRNTLFQHISVWALVVGMVIAAIIIMLT